MGRYRDAIYASADISQSRQTRQKFGAGLNFEQSLSENIGGFARLGWNDSNPAYNSDRGPVSVFSLRLHYEI